MTDLVLLIVFVMFVAIGMLSPFVWGLGYVWVDTFLPQRLSYSLLATVPMALIMGVGAVLSYLLMDRRNPPRITAVHVLCGVMAIWITLTCTWAVQPDAAWVKWDPGFKTVVFTAFMPFIFRTRVQIEALILVLTMAAAGHLLPWGLKTLMTGGGYDQSLGLMGVNTTMLAESSSVAAVSAMFVPLLLWARTHSLLIPGLRARTLLTFGMIGLYLIATVGTFARTGLIAIAVLGAGLLLRSRRKLLFIALALAAGGIMFFVTSDRWTERVSTISSYDQDNSALGRILVWQWTLNFVADNPLGGGFQANIIDKLVFPDGSIVYGLAFHNIFFAVLGEHGYPGLAIYVTILGLSLLSMQRVIRRCRQRPELLWASDLARAAQLGMAILLACGNFVDYSFGFLLWDMVALMMCLNAHVVQVLAMQPAKLQLQAGSRILAAASHPSMRPLPHL